MFLQFANEHDISNSTAKKFYKHIDNLKSNIKQMKKDKTHYKGRHGGEWVEYGNSDYQDQKPSTESEEGFPTGMGYKNKG
jgi:hypothetical protein